MGHATITRSAIWAKHIHGDRSVADRILSMNAGEIVHLRVEGVVGAWRKMDDGRDGRPTRGLRPIGRTQAFWRDLYRERPGDLVAVEISEEGAPPARTLPPLPIYPPFAKSEAERQAAHAAFIESCNAGYRSDGPYGPRDELYDR